MSNQNIYGVQGSQPAGQQFSGQQPNQQLPPIYIQVPPPQRTWGCGTFFLQFIVGVAIFFVSGFLLFVGLAFIGGAMSASLEQLAQRETPLTEKLVTGNIKSTDKIAILSISGVISTEEDGYIVKQIRQISKDPNVKAVVLRVDSPGGTMSGSDYYLHLMQQMKEDRKIPIVVSMGSLAASGGYYVSMIGDEIYAEPTTTTGSIGVIVPLFNVAALCKKIGVESTPITSGNLKAMGSITKQLNDEEKQIWQKLVDDSFNKFKEVIREGRKDFEDDPEKLDKLATGQVYNAKEALDNGLIDKIGYIDDAINRAMDLSGTSELDVKVIKYKQKNTFVESFLDGNTTKNPLNSEAISEITSPKVYLLLPNVLPVK
ncbi:MAG: signal peptide peptidase SppA [Planctomycetaceae bacterium]|jgi:protease-4|nr:signal peptide peptidase SppA [Planctomycetaceae bacterium]